MLTCLIIYNIKESPILPVPLVIKYIELKYNSWPNGISSVRGHLTNTELSKPTIIIILPTL